MPIYEFFCNRCNTIYKFLSKSVNTEKIPTCPRCKTLPLKRMMSLFAAVSKRRGDETVDQAMPDIDERKLEKAMTMLAGEAGGMNEDDPRQAAKLMRKLTDMTGISLGSGMEELMRRMEKGEDPEEIEEEMGDILEGEEPFQAGLKSNRRAQTAKPKVDEELYEL